MYHSLHQASYCYSFRRCCWGNYIQVNKAVLSSDFHLSQGCSEFRIIIATMSSSTPDLVPSDPKVARFYERNDLHVFISGERFFGESTHPHRMPPLTRPPLGFRTGPNVTWGNLCACMSTLVALDSGYNGLFQPKQPSPDESIPWDLQSRQTFGNCKAYDFLGA